MTKIIPFTGGRRTESEPPTVSGDTGAEILQFRRFGQPGIPSSPGGDRGSRVDLVSGLLDPDNITDPRELAQTMLAIAFESGGNAHLEATALGILTQLYGSAKANEIRADAKLRWKFTHNNPDLQ
jgi:hypothetical protein